MVRSIGSAERMAERLESIISGAGSIEAAIAPICDLLQIDFIAYHLAFHGVQSVEKPYVRTNYPDAWVGRYLLMNYIDVDPVAKAGFRSSVPRLWSELDWSAPETALFAADAAKHGLGESGFLVPVIDQRHRRAMVNFCSKKSASQWRRYVQRERANLLRVAHMLHEQAVLELFGRKDDAPRLTSRELECLALAARGLDAPRVARHLGLSEYTVRDYFKAARWKLGCNTLAQSVHKATLLRLIEPVEDPSGSA